MPDQPPLFARPLPTPPATSFVTPPPSLAGIAGPVLSVFEPVLSLVEASRIVGTPSRTLRDWYRDHGLINWVPGGGGTGHHFKLSLMDALVLRLATRLIDGGISPADAAWFIGSRTSNKTIAMGVVLLLGAVITDPAAPSLVAFHPGGIAAPGRHQDRVSAHLLDPAEPVGAMMSRLGALALRTQFLLLDLRDIVDHVSFAANVEFIATEVTQ